MLNWFSVCLWDLCWNLGFSTCPIPARFTLLSEVIAPLQTLVSQISSVCPQSPGCEMTVVFWIKHWINRTFLSTEPSTPFLLRSLMPLAILMNRERWKMKKIKIDKVIFACFYIIETTKIHTCIRRVWQQSGPIIISYFAVKWTPLIANVLPEHI